MEEIFPQNTQGNHRDTGPWWVALWGWGQESCHKCPAPISGFGGGCPAIVWCHEDFPACSAHPNCQVLPFYLLPLEDQEPCSQHPWSRPPVVLEGLGMGSDWGLPVRMGSDQSEGPLRTVPDSCMRQAAAGTQSCPPSAAIHFCWLWASYVDKMFS